MSWFTPRTANLNNCTWYVYIHLNMRLNNQHNENFPSIITLLRPLKIEDAIWPWHQYRYLMVNLVSKLLFLAPNKRKSKKTNTSSTFTQVLNSTNSRYLCFAGLFTFYVILYFYSTTLVWQLQLLSDWDFWRFLVLTGQRSYKNVMILWNIMYCCGLNYQTVYKVALVILIQKHDCNHEHFCFRYSKLFFLLKQSVSWLRFCMQVSNF